MSLVYNFVTYGSLSVFSKKMLSYGTTMNREFNWQMTVNRIRHEKSVRAKKQELPLLSFSTEALFFAETRARSELNALNVLY